jgi:hypothetical protein
MFGLFLNIAYYVCYCRKKHNSKIMFVERYRLTVPLQIATLLIKLVINFPGDSNIYKISDINSDRHDDRHHHDEQV